MDAGGTGTRFLQAFRGVKRGVLGTFTFFSVFIAVAFISVAVAMTVAVAMAMAVAMAVALVT